MTGRKRNVRGEGDALRRQLIEAASELVMAPQAIALPSLRAVARACNVSPAAVYLHFESQASLVRAVLEAQLEALGEHISAAMPPDGTPRDRLAAAGGAYAEWGLQHPGGYQLLFESADRLGVTKGEDTGIIDMIAGLIEAGSERDIKASRVLAYRVWAILHGVVSLRIHKLDMDWPTEPADEVEFALSLL